MKPIPTRWLSVCTLLTLCLSSAVLVCPAWSGGQVATMRVIQEQDPAAAPAPTPAAPAPTPAATTADGANADEGRPQRSFFSGFHLRRSRTGKPSEGALFALARGNPDDDDAETVYSADFYLLWNPEDAGAQFFSRDDLGFSYFVEGHVASNKDDAEDAWRTGLSLWHDPTIMRRDEATRLLDVTDLVFDLAVKYEADRDLETEQILADFSFTFNMPNAGVGEGVPADENSPIFVIWRPVFGIEGGPTLDERADASDEEAPELRLYAHVKAQLELAFLQKGLNLYGPPILFVDEKGWYLPTVGDGAGVGRNLFIAGAEVPLGENVGFQVAYTVGRDAPQFDKVETFEAGLTVRF